MDVDTLKTQRTYIVSEADVHGAVMQVYSMLSDIGTVPTIATEVATAVSELAMNIVKYAGTGGSINVSLQKYGQRFIEIIAEDKGRGIADVRKAMQDHYSTKGTLGVGLPGVKRMMDEFDLKSEIGCGTKVQVKKWLGERNSAHHFSPKTGPVANPAGNPISSKNSEVNNVLNGSKSFGRDYAVTARPCFGEVVNGDGTVFFPLSNGVLIGIIDILGHGQEAHELARFCEKWLSMHLSSDVATLMQTLHQELKGSRGAAMTLAYVSADEITVTGVGNTMLYCIGDQVSVFSAQPGIVGSNFPRLRPVTVPIQPGDVILLTTDGISEHIESQQLINRCRMPVKRIVSGLLHDYGKTYDDATCIAMRHQT